MNSIMDALTTYYGLDWLAMALGLLGMYQITLGNRIGFLFSSLACICGLLVSSISGQVGYVVYNLILMTMMSRTFVSGPKQSTKA